MKELQGKREAPPGIMFTVELKNRKATVRMSDAADEALCNSKLLGYYANIDYLNVWDPHLYVGTIRDGRIWHVESIQRIGGQYRGLKLWRKETGYTEELKKTYDKINEGPIQVQVQRYIYMPIQSLIENTEITLIAVNRVIQQLENFKDAPKGMETESLLFRALLENYKKVRDEHREIRNKLQEYLQIKGAFFYRGKTQ